MKTVELTEEEIVELISLVDYQLTEIVTGPYEDDCKRLIAIFQAILSKLSQS